MRPVALLLPLLLACGRPARDPGPGRADPDPFASLRRAPPPRDSVATLGWPDLLVFRPRPHRDTGMVVRPPPHPDTVMVVRPGPHPDSVMVIRVPRHPDTAARPPRPR